MLSKERLFIIMDLINEKSFITIKELTEKLNVSRSSVMRDLIELENQGLIQRERGGAIAKDASLSSTLSSFNEIPVINKEALYVEEKQKICQQAAKRIKDGDCIYIDSGTTPVYLLPFIVDKSIKIVTTSTYLIRKLPDSFRGDIYLLGGEFKKAYDMSYGPLTLGMIKQFSFDHAFFSTNGVNSENGEVYIFDFSIGAVKKEILARCRNNYLLVDSSKFNVKALCTWANTKEFNAVYTDSFPLSIDMPDNFIVCK